METIRNIGPNVLLEKQTASGSWRLRLLVKGLVFVWLEREFSRDLKRARAAAAEKRVTDAYVSRGGQLQSLVLGVIERATVGADTVRSCVRDE